MEPTIALHINHRVIRSKNIKKKKKIVNQSYNKENLYEKA